ncbi:MAG TPA: DUF4214 domain-containing protein [Ramlibacter sp.]|nr:DUF4214 domain-containing protein [Ramlibacter sp.]
MGTGISASRSLAFTFFIPQSAPQPALTDILAGSKWGGGIGTGVSLTYSFSAASSAYGYSFDSTGVDIATAALTNAQQQSASLAMQTAARYANITFAAAPDTASGAGDVRWAASGDTGYFTNSHSSAFAYYPAGDARGGDIWIDAALNYFSTTTPGNFGFEDFLHELGHALGLSHPDAQGAATDQLKYSVMSYRNFAGDGVTYLAQYYPTTYMLDDVAALQFLYGANTATNADNTNYTWDPAQAVYETIWDGGGFDTIDASNQQSGVTIDLHAGAFSQIGPAFWNGQYDTAHNADMAKMVNDCLAIAYNCTIEGATGSAWADTLIGNDAGNVLDGMGGNDTLVGGNGIDTAKFDSPLSAFDIASLGDQVIVTSRLHANDSDAVHADIERLAFSDVSLALDTSGNVGQIYRLYEAAFHREADAAGQGFYMKQMEGGASLVSIASGFLASPEFQATYGNTNDAQFVTRLYQNTLGREPSAGEVDYHVNALHSISRAQLLVNFSESLENQAHHILGGESDAAQVYRLYDTAFDRAPDTAGLVYQMHAMDAGQSLATLAQQFLASPEFQAKYGAVDNATFATLLYENVLGRAPDAAGLAYQVTVLSSGASRAQLMVDFSESPEHRDAVQFAGVIHDWVQYLPG